MQLGATQGRGLIGLKMKIKPLGLSFGEHDMGDVIWMGGTYWGGVLWL